MTWERARSEEQKDKRISEIVEATSRLLEKYDYGEITFALIAREARFTRSNLYKYFNSREEVFLYLLTYDLKDWENDLFMSYGHDKNYTVEEFSLLWKEILKKRQRMLRLLSLSPDILEKNCSNQALVDYKRASMKNISHLSELLGRIFPVMSQEKIVDFLTMQISLACGLYPIATSLSEDQKKIIENSGVKHMNIDFEEYFYKGLITLLKGLSV